MVCIFRLPYIFLLYNTNLKNNLYNKHTCMDTDSKQILKKSTGICIDPNIANKNWVGSNHSFTPSAPS